MNGSAVFLVAFLTSAATATGSVYVIERYGILAPKTVPDTIVPDFHGVSEADARANANAAHIALLIAAREASVDAKPGSVIRQSIPAGQHVAREYSMSVVLAEEVPRVPNLAGLTVADATQRLEQRGYAAEVAAKSANPTVAAGLVFNQSPKADAPHPKGGAVTLQVSTGPGDVEIPKLVGVGLTQAKADLEKLGVKAVVRWVAMAETPTYVVLSQKPAPGEKAKPGAEVQLTVCR